jgi:NitT/TauT family transport system substrate-binding protein
MTTDPTIKPLLIDAAGKDVEVLQKLGRMKEFDVTKWVDDSYIRKAYAELKLDYDSQLKSLANYEVKGEDTFCHKPISDPHKAGEVWVDGEDVAPFSSAACTLGAYASIKATGKKINVAYVFDTTLGIKLFADQAYYAVAKDTIAPFLLKKEAEDSAAKNGGKVLGFEDALKALGNGG